MSEPFTIAFEWLDFEAGTEIDRAFAASLGVAIGGQYLTRAEDFRAKTVRNEMRGCAWHLAQWFAVNWWRLRWEPASPASWEDADWRMAHSMGAAGGGYVWPNAIFASDGEWMEIITRPNAKNSHFEPIRYLEEIQARISTNEFERKVDEFMGNMLSRLDTLRVSDRTLTQLWAEVLSERRHVKTRRRRKLEAMAGYDPDEAPAALLKQLIQDKEHLGKNAIEEIAAGARHETGAVLEFIQARRRSKTEPHSSGFRGSLPSLDNRSAALDLHSPPWQRASHLARAARQRWGFGDKPILNSALARLVGTSPNVFTEKSNPEAPMPFAVRADSSGDFDVFFDSARPTTRRFAMGRLIGDYLDSTHRDNLLPATLAKTARQKFQRAFAQEFLCPIDSLLAMIKPSKPREDDIEAAAAYFHVSPLMVRTTLVNHHKLDREALNWSESFGGPMYSSH